MPEFVTGLDNTRSFRSLEMDRTEVTTHPLIRMGIFLGVLVAPFSKMRMRRIEKLFTEELKYYAETGEVAESKRRAMVRATGLAAL